MRAHRLRVILTAGALAITALALPDDIVLPEGKAKKLIENACSDCHGLDVIADNPLSEAKWRETVKVMVKRGATLTPAEIDTVVEYLSVYFAADKVNVNTAGPSELQNGLQITADEADAILKYRKANGSFKDLDGLRKVTGIDLKKIEAKKDLIVF